MANIKQIQRLIRKLLSKFKFKYKLVFLDEQTYEEVFMLRLSKLNVFTYFGTGAMLIIAAVTILIAFTPIREYIPGYPSGKERRLLIKNAQRVDSLAMQIQQRDRLLKNMRIIMSGGVIEDNERDTEGESSDSKSKNIAFKRSNEDSVFRSQVEEEDRFNVNTQRPVSGGMQIEQLHLFCPVRGMISSKFGESNGHYGVDILAVDGTRVSAVMDGTVVFAGWTVETGYVIQIQHTNNLISFYKHNSKLLKRIGATVRAGEAIAEVGNSGEMTTGSHLHFELWYKGAPVNPENYISFK
jgi:murein DD-endopeptidase MepM/ murein hydrolase activator NlpD